MNVCEQLSLGAGFPALPAVGTPTVSFEVLSGGRVLRASPWSSEPHPPLTLRPQAPEVISPLRPPGTLGKLPGAGVAQNQLPGCGGERGGFEALSMALGAAWLFR